MSNLSNPTDPTNPWLVSDQYPTSPTGYGTKKALEQEENYPTFSTGQYVNCHLSIGSQLINWSELTNCRKNFGQLINCANWGTPIPTQCFALQTHWFCYKNTPLYTVSTISTTYVCMYRLITTLLTTLATNHLHALNHVAIASAFASTVGWYCRDT
jgi:hypothetical protein